MKANEKKVLGPADYMIKVWPCDQAPVDLQCIAAYYGGGEWLALVPKALKDRYITWLHMFQGIEVDTGDILYIGDGL